jgi:choline dehydrogenase-like flavoprotein
MNIVIGSGPSSVFCALALLKKGESVTMIDSGLTLEAERAQAVDVAQFQSKAEWEDSFLSMIRDKSDPSVGGLPKKLVYGSDYPFRSPDADVRTTYSECESLTSYALGGLSNVWGANVLPLLRAETAEWPVTTDTLWPFYKEVSRHIPICADHDDLTDLFGDCFSHYETLPKSRQISSMFSSLQRHREKLQKVGVHFGASRLAVRAAGCDACGMCLYGCPRRLIYSSADSMGLLRSFPGFSYRPGLLAQQVEESGLGVRILVKTIKDGDKEWLVGDKVYVGCGPISSTALMLASFGKVNEEVRLKDSQYFLSPFLLFRGTRDVTTEPAHTLSQAIVEIIDPSVCERSIHLLFYSYNDMYLRAIQKLCGSLYGIARPLVNKALGHVMVVQGYLHSDCSGTLGLSWKGPSELSLVGYSNPNTKRYVSKALWLLMKKSRAFGGVPFVPLNHVAPIGKSYHLGGSFPMSVSPSGWQSDPLGRIKGLKRVHVVDASVLPAVPAQNTTFTVMANAYRIGAES